MSHNLGAVFFLGPRCNEISMTNFEEDTCTELFEIEGVSLVNCNQTEKLVSH